MILNVSMEIEFQVIIINFNGKIGNYDHHYYISVYFGVISRKKSRWMSKRNLEINSR